MNSYRYANKTIFILGVPRSGTSWIGKIFDAHLDVLYRHEPDILVRNMKLPFLCDDKQVRAHRGEAAEWLNALAATRRLKSAGSLPVFPKSFHTTGQTTLRRAYIYGLKSLQALPYCKRMANAIDVPDFVDIDSDSYRKLVIKSVSGMGRAGLFAAAAPDSRIIVIMRHPCGQVESMLRGVRGSMFEHDIPIKDLATTAQARRLNLTIEDLERESFAGQLAWSWVIRNEMAMEALEAAGQAKLVRYDDVTEDPEGEMRSLFEFCGLDWTRSVQGFLRSSIQGTGREKYYQTKRDPAEAANKWRSRLSEREIEDITRVVSRSAWGRMFLERSGTNGKKGIANKVKAATRP